MKILWMTWKDLTHPLAGGAEVVNEELAKRLVADGHEVTLIVGGYKGMKAEEIIDGYKVVRMGNRLTVYYKVYEYYMKNMRGWADLVIDEVNTIPFFSKFYVRESVIMFFHMLCRQIWFYQLPKWLGWVGYIAEPFYLQLLNNAPTITVSDSTKQDLIKYGKFKSESITIISEGISIKPVEDLGIVKKYDVPTLLSLGALRPMKRTLDQIKAFEIAKDSLPELQMKVAGDYENDAYGRSVVEYIRSSRHASSIDVLGRVSNEKKVELMQRSHIFLCTSIKEGWGLVVTEANSQGTPAIVYDVDGLRDSVRNGSTGLICRLEPSDIAEHAVKLIKDIPTYTTMREAAYEWSKMITFEKSYADFKKGAGIV